MNPLTNMKNVLKLSEQELHSTNKTSWHDQYRDSAWIFVAGFPYDLSEGDLICMFSQYGEIVHINLVRDKDTGKSRGFCFICFEDQRSTDLSVDNLNGIKVLNRSMRVDHVSNYKIPKHVREEADLKSKVNPPVESRPIKAEPLGPVDDFRETLADHIQGEIKLPRRLPIGTVKLEPNTEEEEKVKTKKHKKDKKHKKKKSKKKKRAETSESDSSSDDDSSSSEEEYRRKKKKEKSRK
ncbi:PREDICTED: RNA-binding motif protein, X-linked 2 [Nicrophorus vespilloides]|uniref:RNA-binding motif protein, X-linked 2 n=1 Tax=Nicrophorus vespilloides TaxID=110193 RepID=A0ABM1N502_NICVS|nr:PREDICTED: RNA-binding motif protein, X-linked 2 [Nicrophorus vespilloides]